MKQNSIYWGRNRGKKPAMDSDCGFNYAELYYGCLLPVQDEWN